jgi:hypothetical protein
VLSSWEQCHASCRQVLDNPTAKTEKRTWPIASVRTKGHAYCRPRDRGVFLYILVQEKMKGGGADVGMDNNDFCRLLGEKSLDPGTQRDQSEREACSAAESFEVGTSHRASTIEKACEAGQLLVDLGPMSMSMPMSPGKQMRWV